MKLLLLSFVLVGFHSLAQQRMIIYFSNDPSADRSPVVLSERSEARRQNKSVQKDMYDRSINEGFIAQLNQYGKVLNRSRWLNAVSFETATENLSQIEKLTFVRKIQLINENKIQKEVEFQSPKSIDYGMAFNQVNQINVDCLHTLGYTGEGILLGVIDAGFEGMDTVSYFDNVYGENRIVDTYNFVGGNTSVYHSSYHGTAVSSCIVGEKTGANSYTGTGFDVDLALYLAEDVFSETMIEEFNVVAALERCDSIGVDVVNISLGYFEFDDPNTNHLYSDLDGNTTVAAVGVNIAVSKGIAVVMSAGNSGPSNISTPCDADDGLCVGAVDEMGVYAPFSSVGPNADGQIKPDVSSRGYNAWVIINDGTLVQGSGTSFSSPIMAGAVACLVQAEPTKTVDEIFTSIRMSATQYSNPDAYLGYGIPDFCLAKIVLGIEEENNESSLSVYPNPTSNKITIEAKGHEYAECVQLIGTDGRVILSLTNCLLNTAIELPSLESGMYVLRIEFENSIVVRHLEIQQ